MIFAVWEKGNLMCKVEFIESYIKVGNDYQWNDNHGELIRCKDCTMFKDSTGHCINPRFTSLENNPVPIVREWFYCADGKRKTDG